MPNETLDLKIFKIVVAPEYAQMSEDDIKAFADAALLEVSPEKFGKYFQRAWANLTAHFVFLSKRDSETVGILDSVKVGQVEHRYLNFEKAGQDPNYLVSKYGKEFLRLRSMITRGPIIATPPKVTTR